MTREQRLVQFLGEAAKRPWVWGQSDCTMMVCDWVLSETGIDPAERYRGCYSSDAEAAALYENFVSIIREEFERAGLIETSAPVTGDIGIVNRSVVMRGRHSICRACMAIRAGSLWAAKEGLGVCAGDYPVIAAWSLGG